MTAGECQKRVTALEFAWKFTKPTKPEDYHLIIKTLIEELTKAQKEASW